MMINLIINEEVKNILDKYGIDNKVNINNNKFIYINKQNMYFTNYNEIQNILDKYFIDINIKEFEIKLEKYLEEKNILEEEKLSKQNYSELENKFALEKIKNYNIFKKNICNKYLQIKELTSFQIKIKQNRKNRKIKKQIENNENQKQLKINNYKEYLQNFINEELNNFKWKKQKFIIIQKDIFNNININDKDINNFRKNFKNIHQQELNYNKEFVNYEDFKSIDCKENLDCFVCNNINN